MQSPKTARSGISQQNNRAVRVQNAFSGMRNFYASRMKYCHVISNGEDLAVRETVICDVYRVSSRDQGLIQGNVILDLLYHTYPKLERFQFSAHSYDGEAHKYEIFPRNNIFTPLEGLLNRDIHAILERNVKYAIAYDAGAYTIKAVRERLYGEVGQNVFP